MTSLETRLDSGEVRVVGSWEEVLLFSMDFTVSQNVLESVLQEANLVPDFPESCISRGLVYANAERHRMFLCWSRAVKSGVNQGLYLLVLHFFEWGMLI